MMLRGCPVLCWTAHAADVKKAKEGGFHTVQSLIMNPRKVSLSCGSCIFAA